VLQSIAVWGIALCNAPASVLQGIAFSGIARELLDRLVTAIACDDWRNRCLAKHLRPIASRTDRGLDVGAHLQKPFELTGEFSWQRIRSTGVSAARAHARL
jgi:hypothetical protein